MAMTSLTRSTYSGEFGFLIIDPAAGNPGRYDREVMLAAHHWEGSWVSMQDMKKGPPPDNGLEALYKSATLGDRMLGHGEPILVRQGERVLFRLLNASGSMGISLALSGHRCTVISLDGNPVPTPAMVDAVKLDVAERADVIVEMNNPGVWVFGSTDDDDRNMGMGVVVAYAGRSGEARWIPPRKAPWDYAAFGRNGPAADPDETIDLKYEKIPGGRGGYNRWTINGKSWPDTNPLFTVQQDKRYRLVMNNKSGDEHPVHLHRHSFEITKIGERATSGIIKDTISKSGDRFYCRRSRQYVLPLSPSGPHGGRFCRPYHIRLSMGRDRVKSLGGVGVKSNDRVNRPVSDGCLQTRCSLLALGKPIR